MLRRVHALQAVKQSLAVALRDAQRSVSPGIHVRRPTASEHSRASAVARVVGPPPAGHHCLIAQLPSPLPLGDCASAQNALECALNFDQRTYLHNLSLKRADAMGMAHSLELRVPFINSEVVELASRIPGRMLIRGTQEKYILRRALEPLLPPSITSRRKRGFQMRLNLGMTQTLDYLSNRLLRPDRRAGARILRAWTGRTFASRAAGTACDTDGSQSCGSFRIWSVLMCELWARMFLDRPISPKPPERLADFSDRISIGSRRGERETTVEASALESSLLIRLVLRGGQIQNEHIAVIVQALPRLPQFLEHLLELEERLVVIVVVVVVVIVIVVVVFLTIVRLGNTGRSSVRGTRRNESTCRACR